MVRLDAIAWHARHHPGRPALHDLGSGHRWSYGQADAAIARAAGVLVGRPDARWGEVGHLFVVPERGASAQAAALLQHLEERLARYKVPKFVRHPAAQRRR